MERPPEKKHPLLSLRPRFDMTVFILEAIPVTFAGTAALTFVGGTFLFILFSLSGISRFISAGSIYVTMLLLGVALIPPVFYEIKRRAFARTAWHFYDSHIEFQFFRYYLVRERGRLRYGDISNVMQQAGALQERLQLTTIFLISPASGTVVRGGLTGVKITDIPEINGVGRRVLDLIDKANTAQQPVYAAAGTS